MRNSHGRDHGIGSADRLPGTIQVAGYPPRKVSGGLIEKEYLVRDDSVPKGLETIRGADPLQSLNDFHHSDDGDR
jgi:hypothetical protein